MTPSNSGDWRRLSMVWALAVAAFLVAPLAVVAPLGLAPLAGITGLVCLLACLPVGPWRGLDPLVGWALAITVVLGVLSGLWAIDPLHSLRTASAFAVTTLLGLPAVAAIGRLDDSERTRVGEWLTAGLLLAAGILGFEMAFGGILVAKATNSPELIGNHLHRYNRGSTVLAILGWAGTWYVWASARRWRTTKTLVLLLLTLGAAAWSEAMATKLAIAVSVLTFGFGLAIGRRVFPVLGVAAVLALTATPALVRLIPDPAWSWENASWLPGSAHHRLTIWQFAGSKMEERPVLGWGVDSSRSFPDGNRVLTLRRQEGSDGPPIINEQVMPLHPHNAFVQWWLELGVPGALTLALMILGVCRAAWRYSEKPEDAAFISAMMGAVLVVACISFGAWQSWWLGAVWLVAAFARLGQGFQSRHGVG